MLSEQIFNKATSVLNQTTQYRKDYVAACRFFRNSKVDHQKIISPLLESTAHCSAGKDVLVIQDTTEINYEHHSGFLNRNDNHLGPTGNNIDIGFFVHPSIVVDMQTQMLLGASEVHIWNRRYSKKNTIERDYKNQPIEDKESYRWIKSCLESKKTLRYAKSILFVSDRESDIYEEFIEVPDHRSDLLIRSSRNRTVYGSDKKLYQYLDSLSQDGSVEVDIRAAKYRKARKAILSVKFSKLRIAKPKRHYQTKLLPESLELYAIEVKELPSTVPPTEDPVYWVLLTTKPVETLQQALDIIRLYALRWQIELIFSTLKTKGLDVESSELETGRALKSMCAMSLITAIRINQLRLAHNKDNGIQATLIFTQQQIQFIEVFGKTLEGNTKQQKNPHVPKSLAWAVWVIARLGGWKGYGSESPPGNKTMHIGWNDFNKIYQGWGIWKDL